MNISDLPSEQKPALNAGSIADPEATSAARRRSALNGLRFLISRTILIGGAIFLAVFLTVLLINNPSQKGRSVGPSQLETRLRQQIDLETRIFTLEHPELNSMPADKRDAVLRDFQNDLINESGLNLPFLTRHLKWTLNALSFDWGRLSAVTISPFWVFNFRTVSFNVNEIVLQYMPFSVLLAVSSYFLIFFFGIPLALISARNYGRWLDRLMGYLAPLSSIPSWVMGILLILIFAIELKLLPMGGIFDTQPPATGLGYIPIVLKHMVLPVTSILLTALFQLAYSWRTYFIAFAEEDYVDLARAKGLTSRILEKKYILKPSLPYVITSFSLMFVSYWQISMALEVVFNWRGIGWLYIKYGLPNFWGESMYPGELLIALTLVVILAYLLGSIVFILDIAYILVDPRIRLDAGEMVGRVKRPRSKLDLFRRHPKPARPPEQVDLDQPFNRQPRLRSRLPINRPKNKTNDNHPLRRVFIELKRYPSALFGLLVIVLLLLGSVYAITALPYADIGAEWGGSTFNGQPDRPKLAKPGWINLFRTNDYLSTIHLSTRSKDVVRTETANKNGVGQVSYSFTFDYNHKDFPTEFALYLEGLYNTKRPFVSLEWVTPDGRVINLKGTATGPKARIQMENTLSIQKLLSQNPSYRKWFITGTNYPTPVHYLLFADPAATEPVVIRGTYQIIMTGLVFEPESDFRADLWLFGQVYGAAGTDLYRRDLVVPLVWGMPFALIIGLVGSLSTAVLSMLVAAAGAWYGRWVDNLVQRITEVNLIMPVLAICVLAHAYLGLPIWAVLAVIILSSVFGSPTKNFRAAFLQIRGAPYIEAAQVYGASDFRIVWKYLMPRILSTLIPQIILLIPSFVFLEATLGFFNISSNYPTWGKVIYQALTQGAWFGSRYWVVQPLILLMVTGLGFSLLGVALERVLNPRLTSG